MCHVTPVQSDLAWLSLGPGRCQLSGIEAAIEDGRARLGPAGLPTVVRMHKASQQKRRPPQVNICCVRADFFYACRGFRCRLSFSRSVKEISRRQSKYVSACTLTGQSSRILAHVFSRMPAVQVMGICEIV